MNYIKDKYDLEVYTKASDNISSEIFEKRIWRVSDVAKFLGCTIGHVYNLVSDDKIPKIKKGKILYFIPEKVFDWLVEGELQ